MESMLISMSLQRNTLPLTLLIHVHHLSLSCQVDPVKQKISILLQLHIEINFYRVNRENVAFTIGNYCNSILKFTTYLKYIFFL